MRLRALLLAAALGAAACGDNDRPPPETAKAERGPQWQDVFDGTPELYAVVRPPSLKKDALYGNFYKNLVRVAQARGGLGQKLLDAASGCDEIVIGIHRTPELEETAVVFRGVPASLDVDRMTDDRGNLMFALADPRAKVHEYVRSDRRSGEAVSLFTLPDRTWVLAIGSARERARAAFAAPFGRPVPKSDPNALLSLRLNAETFLRHRPFEKGIFGPLTRKLSNVTLALQPGNAGIVTTLVYEDDDAVAWAEMHAKRTIDDIVKSDAQQAPQGNGRWAWLKDAKVSREGTIVTVSLPVPPRLLEDLPGANAGDMGF